MSLLKRLFLCLLIGLSFVARGQNIERIPLKDIRLPSNDLVDYTGEILSSEEAFQLKKEGLDLSQLDPGSSELWSKRAQRETDQIIEGEDLDFKYGGSLTSQSGLLRFNAEAMNHEDPGPYIIHLDKTLHTLLLRKNLLRKLGYKIPKIQYKKSVRVLFESLEQKERFVKRRIPENTFGAPNRWVTRGLEDSSLEVILQDVAITRPSELDHYNLAMGVPPRNLSSRTLRSLVVAYALLDIGESANKVTWSVGRIENDHYLLPHFTLANMNATTDDAIWMLDRLKGLNREDFQEIVEQAYFPKAVEKLIVEKIISRRNSLFELFGRDDIKELSYDSTPSFKDDLVDGKVTQENWPGYAARFAHGAPDSPFESVGYLALSEIQSSSISNLISKANEYLSAFDINEARLDFLKKDFQEGLENFVETGVFEEQKVKTWTSPILDGQLILSRDIVVGNYLGTDNLVQLADTIGYSVRLGAFLGIERLLNFSSASLSADLSLIKTYSHLKPVRSLKESLKEPYKNMIVPILKHSVKKQAGRMAQYLEDNPDVEQEEKDEELDDIMSELNKSLGVGESIIITQRISPRVGFNARMVVVEGSSLGLGVNMDELVIKRLHLFRKDSKTLQVYVDNGQSRSLTFSFQVDQTIPLLRFQDKNSKGEYDLEVYSLDLNTDTQENPNILSHTKALAHLLESDSTELLKEVSTPHQVRNNFKDRSQRFGLLHWRSRSLTKNDKYSIKSGDSPKADFIRTSMGLQSGLNYRAFLTDIVNYYLGQYFEGIRIGNELWKNPGQTYFGVSQTAEGRFEARLNKEINSLQHMFLSLEERREGWSISQDKLTQQLNQINQRYGQDIFKQKVALETTDLKVYTINTRLNIYENGIYNLLYKSSEQLKRLQRKYRERSSFSLRCRPNRNRVLVRNTLECGNFAPILDRQQRCQRYHQENSYESLGKCLLKLGQSLKTTLDFSDFKKLIGQENLYLSGQVNGFRDDSEILSDPIQADTIGSPSSRFVNGPLESLRQMLGLQNGEFTGSWLREFL